MRRPLTTTLLIATTTTTLLATAAWADAPKPGLTLPKGKLSVAVNLEIEMSADRVAKPISLSPDVSYGVTPDLTVALVHSRVGLTGFRAAVGGGLCLTGEDNGCVAVYNNVGAEGWYNVARGPLAAAVGAGFHATNLDAGFYHAKVGARVRYTAGQLGVHFSPSVLIAAAKRDEGGVDSIWLPVQGTYKATPELTVGVGTGIKGPLDGFGDAWQVPVGVMGTYAIDPATTVGASWVFGQLLGGATNPPDPAPPVKGVDYRGLQIWGARTF
jgi:hypothetical protein